MEQHDGDANDSYKNQPTNSQECKRLRRSLPCCPLTNHFMRVVRIEHPSSACSDCNGSDGSATPNEYPPDVAFRPMRQTVIVRGLIKRSGRDEESYDDERDIDTEQESTGRNIGEHGAIISSQGWWTLKKLEYR
jgi:hypothetical protein